MTIYYSANAHLTGDPPEVVPGAPAPIPATGPIDLERPATVDRPTPAPGPTRPALPTGSGPTGPLPTSPVPISPALTRPVLISPALASPVPPPQGTGRPSPGPMAAPRPEPSSPGFRILHVCVANQCRSPMGERLTRRELAIRFGATDRWAVASAGTLAIDGRPMHPCAVNTLTGLGADPSGFASQRLTAHLTGGSDLILAATAVERDLVIAQDPNTLATAFTLLEFARLITAVPGIESVGRVPEAELAEYARAMVGQARRMRGRIPFIDPDLDDVPDPPRTNGAFQQTASVMLNALSSILRALTNATAGPDPVDRPVGSAQPVRNPPHPPVPVGATHANGTIGR